MQLHASLYDIIMHALRCSFIVQHHPYVRPCSHLCLAVYVSLLFVNTAGCYALRLYMLQAGPPIGGVVYDATNFETPFIVMASFAVALLLAMPCLLKWMQSFKSSNTNCNNNNNNNKHAETEEQSPSQMSVESTVLADGMCLI